MTRLLVAFATVMLVFAAATVLAIVRLAQFNEAARSITGPQLQHLQRAEQWLDAVQESARLLSTALIRADQYDIPDQVEAIQTVDARALEQLRALQVTSRSPEETTALNAVVAARANYAALEEGILSQATAGQIAMARMALLSRTQDPQRKYLASLQQLREVEKNDMTAATQKLAATYTLNRSLLIAMFLVAMLASAILAYRNARAIQRPLLGIISHFDDIRAGKLSASIPLHARGEIGQVLESLRETQRVLREAATHAADCDAQVNAIRKSQLVLELTSDGSIAFANDQFLETLGYRLDEILSQHYTLFVAPKEQHTAQYQAMWEHMARGQANSGLQRLIGRSGREVWLQATFNPLLNPEGRPYKIVMIATDATERVRMTGALDVAIKEIHDATQAATEGRLTVRVGLDAVTTTGPIAALVANVNALLDTLMDVVDRIKTNTAEIQRGANQISHESSRLSERTEEQAASLEESAASMMRMADHVSTAADHAEQARQLALAAQEQAQSGGAIVRQAVQAMHGISASSSQIAHITDVIDEIAFQTNLLALNAAVEAARAGAHGEAFAVVANEVRNLANRSAASAKQIAALISEGVRRIELGERLVDQSGQALEEIGTAITRVTDATTQIAQATQAQAAGIEQVSKAVSQMEETTRQNASLVEETSASTRVITDQITQLAALVERFEVTTDDAAPQASAGNNVVRLNTVRHGTSPPQPARDTTTWFNTSDQSPL